MMRVEAPSLVEKTPELAHWRYRVKALERDAERGWIGSNRETYWLLEEARYMCELVEVKTLVEHDAEAQLFLRLLDVSAEGMDRLASRWPRLRYWLQATPDTTLRRYPTQ
jgi:hypothetical protein